MCYVCCSHYLTRSSSSHQTSEPLFDPAGWTLVNSGVFFTPVSTRDHIKTFRAKSFILSQVRHDSRAYDVTKNAKTNIWHTSLLFWQIFGHFWQLETQTIATRSLVSICLSVSLPNFLHNDYLCQVCDTLLIRYIIMALIHFQPQDSSCLSPVSRTRPLVLLTRPTGLKIRLYIWDNT